MEDAPGGDRCLNRWAEENNRIVCEWRGQAKICTDPNLLLQRRQRCRSDLDILLQKIKGLPLARPSASLELSVAYNAVILHINLGNGVKDECNQLIEETLVRVLEAHGLDYSNETSSALWKKAFLAECLQELSPNLQALAALQSLVWVAQGNVEDVLGLFRLFVSFQVSNTGSPTSVLKTWAPAERTEAAAKVLDPMRLKEALCVAVALQQGLHRMGAGDPVSAFDLFQEAVDGQCTSALLAKIYNCQGYCLIKMGKPQLSLQYMRQSLQLDFRCLSALYNSSLAYRELGRLEAEIEVLNLLYKALCLSSPEAPAEDPGLLIKPEQFVDIERLNRWARAPCSAEIKYLLARRCLQSQRVAEAAENFTELLEALRHESYQEAPLPSPAPLPAIAEVFLEAAASFIHDEKFDDAASVCEDVLAKSQAMIPGRLVIDGAQEARSHTETDQINCVLWTSAARLFQAVIQGLLGEHKKSVEEFSRSLNVLLAVQFTNADRGRVIDPAAGGVRAKDMLVFDVLKACSFIGRGRQFLELEKGRDALLNAQLGLQTSPAFPQATAVFLSCLWQLNRKEEAVFQWRRLQANKTLSDQQWKATEQFLPLFLLQHINHKFYTNEAVLKAVRESAEGGDGGERMELEP
ncbi:Fanconi anemia group G protein isoform X2 [Spea bombifrons]|uniref:Fanconi anemia group G protein isoform X2 n=1 Tax=Spea bombifrons TaxID=233779 RepID=UPI00234AD136|nr:Fanconi anemia group G protein isoform X2 [Spea bombifrons]